MVADWSKKYPDEILPQHGKIAVRGYTGRGRKRFPQIAKELQAGDTDQSLDVLAFVPKQTLKDLRGGKKLSDDEAKALYAQVRGKATEFVKARQKEYIAAVPGRHVAGTGKPNILYMEKGKAPHKAVEFLMDEAPLDQLLGRQSPGGAAMKADEAFTFGQRITRKPQITEEGIRVEGDLGQLADNTRQAMQRQRAGDGRVTVGPDAGRQKDVRGTSAQFLEPHLDASIPAATTAKRIGQVDEWRALYGEPPVGTAAATRAPQRPSAAGGGGRVGSAPSAPPPLAPPPSIAPGRAPLAGIATGRSRLGPHPGRIQIAAKNPKPLLAPFAPLAAAPRRLIRVRPRPRPLAALNPDIRGPPRRRHCGRGIGGRLRLRRRQRQSLAARRRLIRPRLFPHWHWPRL